MLKITLGSESWQFDPADMSMKALIEMEDVMGCGVIAWLDQIDERRALALQYLIWHLRGGSHAPTRVKRGAETPADVDFRLGDFSLERVREAVPLVEAEPEQPATGGFPVLSASTG